MFKNSKNKVFLIILITIITVLITNVTIQSSSTELERLKNRVKTGSWIGRAFAAESLAVSSDIKLDERVRIILDAIEQELQNPISKEYISGSTGTKSEMLIRRYLFALRDLGHGVDSLMTVYKYSNNDGIKKSAIMILGFHGDDSVCDGLREIIRNDPDPNMRSLAIRVLGEYKKKEDVPLFLNALRDTFNIKNTSDVYYPARPSRIYLVREDAAGVLRGIGYKIIEHPEGWEAVKEEK